MRVKKRRTVSLDEEQLILIQPLLEKHGGNFSSAVRELISNYAQRESVLGKADHPLSAEEIRMNVKELRHRMVEEKIAGLTTLPLLRWYTSATEGIVPPMGAYRIMMDKYIPEYLGFKDFNIKDYMAIVHENIRVFGAQHRQYILIEDPKNPERIRIRFEELGSSDVEFGAKNVSYLLAHEPFLLKPTKVARTPTYITVDFEPCANEEEAHRALVEHFGRNQMVYEKLMRNPEYWRDVFWMASVYNDDLVIMGKRNFLKVIAGEDISSSLISTYTKALGKSLKDFEFEELLEVIRRVGKTSGLLDSLVAKSGEIHLFYAFEDEGIGRQLSTWIANILNKAGHPYTIKDLSPDSSLLVLESASQ